MNKGISMIKRTLYGLVSAAATVAFLAACSIESANEVIRQVDANVAGVYRNGEANQNNGKFVSVNSGREVTFLDVRQTGNQLEAIDNNAIIFRGTVGDPRDNQAQFNIEGRTTAGNRALISGSIAIGEGQGTMRATWIEDNLVGTVYGVANGPSIVDPVDPVDPDDPDSVSISPTTATLVALGNRTFEAQGGSGNYSWTLSNGNIGSLSANSGSSVQYTALGVGSQRITVTSGNQTAVATVTQN